MGATSSRRHGFLVAAVGMLAACNYYDFEAGLEADTDAGDSDGADDPTRDPRFTPEQWAQIKSHSPLPVPPPDPTNRYADDPAAAELGQRFYFENDYAGSRTGAFVDRDQDCGGCHDPRSWFQWRTTEATEWRETPSVVNAVFYDWFLWDGGKDSMWSQSLGPPEQQMGSDRVSVVRVIWEKYGAEYNAVFGDEPLTATFIERLPEWGLPGDNEWELGPNPWLQMSEADRGRVTRAYVNFGKAVAAYQRLLVSDNSPFDRYAAGELDAISESAKRGLELFIGRAKCAECHSGPAFTDNGFHNIGLGSSQAPEGRFLAISMVLADEFNGASVYSDDRVRGANRLEGLMPTLDDVGKFRTKHLRQIGSTGRYMHAGQLATLREVVEFYNDPPSPFVGELDPILEPLGLSDEEVGDLVEFLFTLTGDPVPTALRTDTAAL